MLPRACREANMPARVYVAIVEDDESVCRALKRLLHNAGLSPITYRSAEEFLDDRARVAFSCLIVDIHLDDISGLELARRLLACKIPTPVIYITANDDAEMRSQALEAGAFDYFHKSASGSEVLAAIQRAVLLTAHQESLR
jgi:FixJ family two-component response regulator